MFERLFKNLQYLESLLESEEYNFDENLRGILPAEHGVYRIYEIVLGRKKTLRVGRTKNLRQRIYHNHFMGDQQGNIRAQLVRNGIVENLEEATEYLREKCKVQFLKIQDNEERKCAEYFILSIIKPEFFD